MNSLLILNVGGIARMIERRQKRVFSGIVKSKVMMRDEKLNYTWVWKIKAPYI